MSGGVIVRRPKSTRKKNSAPSPVEERPPFAVRRFTVDEYHRLIDAGILQDGDPYELLDGWITRKMTKNPPHEVCLRLLHLVLGNLVVEGWMFDSQLAMTLSTSEPEPDGMIVKGTPRDYLSRHPRPDELALVIEVADSSLERDRMKAALYAQDKIARYWIVNLVDRVIEDYSQPTGTRVNAKYKLKKIVGEQEVISLTLGRKTATLAVRDILP